MFLKCPKAGFRANSHYPGCRPGPPYKLAFDFMWYAGEFSISHRVNFNRFYVLTARVVPGDRLQTEFASDK